MHSVMDGRTNQRTNRRTNQTTNKVTFSVACARLKTIPIRLKPATLSAASRRSILVPQDGYGNFARDLIVFKIS